MGLNGIEAARQIRKVSYKSKILFVTQESSANIVQEALRVGAFGYVVKTHAGSELLAGVEAVCQGKRFVSAGLADHVHAELADVQVPKRLRSDELLG
jgi:DNA-binding NarL/FixJ family response regulator